MAFSITKMCEIIGNNVPFVKNWFFISNNGSTNQFKMIDSYFLVQTWFIILANSSLKNRNWNILLGSLNNNYFDNLPDNSNLLKTYIFEFIILIQKTKKELGKEPKLCFLILEMVNIFIVSKLRITFIFGLNFQFIFRSSYQHSRNLTSWILFMAV